MNASREASSPRRFGWVVGVVPEMRDEYLRLHSAVWPGVEAMIHACGIRNYTIFLRGDTLFAYYEYVGDDHEADLRKMAADPETKRWWALTDPCQVPIDSDAPENGWAALREVWHED